MVNSLQDIIVSSKRSKRLNSNFKFNVYKPKDEIASKVYSSLKQHLDKDGEFYLSDSLRSSGLLSVADGITSLSTLNQMGVDAKSEEYRNLFNTNLSALFKYLNFDPKPETPTIELKLSPYYSECDIKSIDVACKVVSCVMEAREILFSFDNDKDRELIQVPGIGNAEDCLYAFTDIMNYLLKTINESVLSLPESECFIKTFIRGEETEKFEVKHSGWNYRKFDEINESEKDNLAPSFYFTYQVSNAYISIYENLEEAILVVRGDKEPEAFRSEKDRNKFDRDFNFFNKIKDNYAQLRSLLVEVGLYFDKKMSPIDIRDHYLSADWAAIDNDEIERSTTNNALFNTLFAISILNNAGILDKYSKYNPERRYLSYSSSAVQNVYDIFMDLDAKNKVYIVDQYILNFNEFIPTAYVEEARHLRKLRIQAITLVPLLVKTYTLISKWVVQYPQKQMTNYLELVMDSRHKSAKNDDKKDWYWDKDSFDMGVNSIFINTLYDFYEYYEKYEAPFIDVQATIEKASVELEKTKVQLTEDAIKQKEKIENSFEEERKRYENEIAKLKYDLDNVPLVVEVRKIAKSVLENELIKVLPKVLDETRNYLYSREDPFRVIGDSDRSNENIDQKELAKSFVLFLTSYMKQDIFLHLDEYAGTNSVDRQVLISRNYKGLEENRNFLKGVDDVVDSVKNKIYEK